LAEEQAAVDAEEKGVPVLVNPVIVKDTMADAKLGMEILVGPDEISLKKQIA
jgi:hypothetical protein